MAAPTPRPAALKLLTGRPGGRDSSGYRVDTTRVRASRTRTTRLA